MARGLIFQGCQIPNSFLCYVADGISQSDRNLFTKCLSLSSFHLIFLWNKSNFLKSCRYVCLFVTICTKKQVETLHATFTKAQRMFEIVILTTGFGEFEFFRTFSHLLLPDKKCGIIQIKSPELSKSAGKSNSPKCKKVRKIEIPKM